MALVTVFDKSGAVIVWEMTREELEEFEIQHLDDDLNYSIEPLT